MDHIDDNNVEKLNYSLIVEVYFNECKDNKRLVRLIDWLAIKSVPTIIEILISITYIWL